MLWWITLSIWTFGGIATGFFSHKWNVEPKVKWTLNFIRQCQISSQQGWTNLLFHKQYTIGRFSHNLTKIKYYIFETLRAWQIRMWVALNCIFFCNYEWIWIFFIYFKVHFVYIFLLCELSIHGFSPFS